MLFHVLLANRAGTSSGSGSGSGGEPVEESLTLTATVTSSPSSGDKYDIGDTLTFNVVLGSAGSNLPITLTVTGMPNRSITVPGGGASAQQYTKTITKEDINASGTLTITCSAVSGELNASDSFSVSLVDPYINISMALTEVNPLQSGQLYEVGDTVSWSCAIAGTGSLNAAGCSLEIYCNGDLIDSDNAYDVMAGVTDTITGTRTVTAADAGLGELAFSAILKEPAVGGVEKPAWKVYLDIDNIDTDVDLSWRFIVNTKLQNSSNVNTGIPLRLYGMDASTEFEVDWGDNSTTTLTPASYTNSDSSASQHAYATGGTYTITITASASDWNAMKFISTSGNNTSTSSWNAKTLPIFWFRNTVTEILDPIPTCSGSKVFSSLKPGTSDEGTAGTTFNYMFYSSKLTTIPNGLFSLNQYATAFIGTFYNSALAAIPNTTFYGCTAATSYDHCFYGCTAITTVSSGLFNWAEGVLDFSYLFYGCTNLVSMGAGLFANSPLVTAFWSSWKKCSKLQALPASLFAYTPLATNFESAFSTCSKIASIDASTFESCTGITTLQQCFENCTSLTAIPSGLLANCPNITNFKSAWSKATKLASIPSDLFSACAGITTVEACFTGCSALGNFDITFIAPNIATVTNFVPGKSGAVRNVTVPANSTTETKFNGVASSMTLTVIPV